MKATSIYNRRGTVHEWHLANLVNRAGIMRSYCGLMEMRKNLDPKVEGLPLCTRCKKPVTSE